MFKEFKLGIRLKLVLVFISLITVLAFGMGFYAYYTMKGNLISSAENKLKSDLALGRQLIEEKLPGDWAIIDNHLYKGKTQIDNNYEVVDLVGSLTGDNATIFRYDTRVATNVKKNDERMVNTKVSDQVAEVVLKQGKRFVGEADVVGTRNLAAYEPLFNVKQEVVGIWFVGVPVTPYQAIADQFRNNLLIFGLLGYLLSILAAWFITDRQFVRPLIALTSSSQQVAAGDLTHTLQSSSQDEIGELAGNFNQMVNNLKSLVLQISDMTVSLVSSMQQLSFSANESGQASEQVAVTMGDLARGASSQAESTQNTARIVSGMTKSLSRVDQGTQKVGQVTDRFSQVVEDGMEAVSALTQNMQQSMDCSLSLEQAIKDLSRRSQEISQIVEVISNIASQTNLLALNAAIEAARAGEMGRGFAVVADEVRKLAEGSAQAALQISQLISDIQSGTDTAVIQVGEALSVIKGQAQSVDTTELLFRNIEKGIGDINNEFKDAMRAMSQMAGEVEEIIKAVENISAITQQSAASAQEVSAISDHQAGSMRSITASIGEVSTIASKLKDAVNVFKI